MTLRGTERIAFASGFGLCYGYEFLLMRAGVKHIFRSFLAESGKGTPVLPARDLPGAWNRGKVGCLWPLRGTPHRRFGGRAGGKGHSGRAFVLSR